MRVAVLGAYGAVGHRVVELAMHRGHTMTAAGRAADRLARVPAQTRRLLRVEDTDAVADLAAENDVVVDATGAERPEVATAVTEGGAAYLDISAEGDHLARLAALPVRRPVAAGVGLAPGLTNLLAATLAGPRPVHIGIVGGAGEVHGAGARRWIWQVAGRTVTSGGRPERVYRSGRRFTVPGLGRRTLLRAAFGEQDQLATDLARPVSTWLGLDPGWATLLLRLAGAAPALAPHLGRLSGPVAGLLGGRDRWALVATDGAGQLRWASGRGEVEATAVMAVQFLAPVLQAPAGVHPAHRLLTLAEVTGELAAAGIASGSGVPAGNHWRHRRPRGRVGT